MCQISQLKYKQGNTFTGTYRLRKPVKAISRSNTPYMACTLEDATGSLKVYLWGEESTCAVSDMDLVTATCSMRRFNDEWIADIVNVEKYTGTPENPLDLIPDSFCPKPELLVELRNLVDTLSHNGIRQFVISVLTDDEILLPFVRLPASKNHHHAQSGGLLEQSLGSAIKVADVMGKDHEQTELAIVGALFHDVAKVRTLAAEGKLTPTGYLIGHDFMTLEVLAPHFKALDKIYPDIAIALRYIWSWNINPKKSSKSSISCTALAEIVTGIDRFDTALQVDKEAFQDKPEWQNSTKYKGTSFRWRPSMEAKRVAA
jgi:23S rRNA maturation-related 3'-5' exoribonuclease YhaM